MTQPVQEPSQGRTDQGQAFRVRQLYRRPASAGGGGVPDAFAILEFDAQTVNGTMTPDFTDGGSSPDISLDLSDPDLPSVAGPGWFIISGTVVFEGLTTRRCAASFSLTGGVSASRSFVDGYNDGYSVPRSGVSEVGAYASAFTSSTLVIALDINNFSAGTDDIHGSVTIARFPIVTDW